MVRAHYRDAVLGRRYDGSLQALADAAVAVYEPGTTTPIAATMYDAASGGNVLTNPLASDADGVVEFWLDADQRVDLAATRSGYAAQSWSADVTAEGTLTDNDWVGGTITGAAIAGGTITGATVTGTTLASPTITTPTVAGGTFTSPTIAGTLTLSAASSKIVPGATSLALRDHADAADNLVVTDAGLVSTRTGVGVATAASASVQLAVAGTVTGKGLDISPSVTATGAAAYGTHLRPTLNAAANNDVLYGMRVSPTLSVGAFTGTEAYSLLLEAPAGASVNLALRANGQVRVQSQVSIGSAPSTAIALAVAGSITGTALDISTTVTATGAAAYGTHSHPTVTAAANNDVLYGHRLNSSFSVGAFTGTTAYGLYVDGPNAGATQVGIQVAGGGIRVVAGGLAVNTSVNTSTAIVVGGTIAGTGTTQYGVFNGPTINSSATVAGMGMIIQLAGSNSGTYTTGDMTGLYVNTISKGTSQTISTTVRGIYVAAQSAVSGGTNYGIYVEAPSNGATANIGIYNAGSTRLVGAVGFSVAPSATTAAVFPASTTGVSSLRINSGTAPSSPVSGDLWYDGTNLKFRDGGTTRTLTWA